MNDTRTQAGDEIVEQVSALVEGVFDRLKPVLTDVEALLGDAGARASDLDRLRPRVVDCLGGLVVGAGFVAAPDILADQRFGFEWWTSDPAGGPPSQLFISLDPASPTFLDYTRQSWFTVPRDTGKRHINGPYVDYLCTDSTRSPSPCPRGATACSPVSWARTCSCGRSNARCSRSCARSADAPRSSTRRAA